MSETQARGRISASFREVVVIVMGVLLALGADSAWSERQERGTEAIYLRALVADLNVTAERISEALAEDSVSMHRSLSMYRLLTGEILDAPNDSMNVWAGMRYADFRPQLTTMRVLVETGDVTLLGSTEVRTSIIGLLAEVENVDRWLGQAETFMFSNSKDQTHYWEEFGGLEGQTHDLEALRGSISLRASYLIHWEGLLNHVGAIESLVTPVNDLRSLLRDSGD